MTNIDELDEKTVATLVKIRKFEEETPKEQWLLGWEWHQVGVPQATINRLITLDLVKRTFSSNSTKAHALTDKAKAIMDNSMCEDEQPQTESTQSHEDIHAIEQESVSMFNDIIGYDDLKELLRECLLLEKPIHVLLVGPPAIAKSMFLSDIERVWGDRTMWMLGSGTSRAGLWDAVTERRPRIMLIDELDKMATVDTAALLSLMETGRIVRTKVHRNIDVQLNAWVIASANRLTKMSPELLSRFKVYNVQEYDAMQFREVITNAICSRESIDRNAAAEIAMRLVNKTHDVREAVRVARLSKRVGVKRAVELLVG